MIMPSSRACGSRSRMYRSLNVPGSPSSAFTTRYFGFGLSFGMNDHFLAVGNPAPPRPRRFDRETSSMICAGVMEKRLLGSDVASARDVRVPPRSVRVLEPRREHRSIGGDKRLWLVGSRSSHRAARSASRRMASRVPVSFRGPTNCSSSWAIGAISHAHRHSTSVTVSSPPGGRLTRANVQALLDAGPAHPPPRATGRAGSCRREARAGPPVSCGTSSRRKPPRARGRRPRPGDVRPRTPPRREIWPSFSCTSHKSGNMAARGSS